MSEGQSPSSYGCRHSLGQYCMGLEHWGNTVVQLLEATYSVLPLDYLLSSRLGCIRMWGMRDALKASSSDLEVAKRPTIAPAAPAAAHARAELLSKVCTRTYSMPSNPIPLGLHFIDLFNRLDNVRQTGGRPIPSIWIAIGSAPPRGVTLLLLPGFGLGNS